MVRKKILTVLIVSSLITGTTMVAHSGYFYARGLVAQVLLENAWKKSKWSGQFVKPLGMEMSCPVAKLTIHSIDLSRVVLNNASHESLALGPAHLPQSAMPGTKGNITIAGHRDSFFRDLKRVKSGDVIELESLKSVQYFKVTKIEIADPRDTHWAENTDDNAITLITCYPFDYVGPAPQRYVVRGRLIKEVNYRTSRG